MADTRKDFDECKTRIIEECISKKLKQALANCKLFYSRDLNLEIRNHVSESFWRREIEAPVERQYQQCVSNAKKYYKIK